MSATDFKTAPGAAPKQHRADIDGLRAIAVLSVLGFHTRTHGFSGGFVGVDIFFVISGYLICSIIVREIEQDKFSIAGFYQRRCKRILPALFAVMLFCALVAIVILSPIEAKHLGNGMTATSLSFSNVYFYLQGSYFDRGGLSNPLLMTWSLAVEEQFYIVFPLLMLLLYKRSRKHLFATLSVLCCLSLLLSIYAEYKHPEFNFYLPFTRAWELGAGTLLAVWQAHARGSERRPRWLQTLLGSLGLLMVAGSIVFYSPATRFPGYEAIPPVLGTLLLLTAAGGIANDLLGSRPLVAVGLISYSLYLWHWPLLSFAEIVGPEPPSPVTRAVLMLIAGGLATLSYFFIETPFRTARYASTTRVLATYAGLIAVFVILGAAFSATAGFPQRVPKLARIERSLEMERGHGCISAADRGPIVSAACLPPATSMPAVALLGDSHAEALAPTVRQNAAAAGQQVVEFASFSCPPLKGFTRSLANAPQHGAACARFNARVLDLLSHRNDVKTVILAGAWAMVAEDKFVPTEYRGNALELSAQESGDNLILGITSEIGALEAQGKRVILLDDVPSLPFAPIDRLRSTELPVRRFLAGLAAGQTLSSTSQESLPRSETVTPEAEAVRSALLALSRTHPTLQVVDTKQLFCTSADCIYSDGTNLFYTDNSHVSRFGAMRMLAGTSLAPRETLPSALLQSH